MSSPRSPSTPRRRWANFRTQNQPQLPFWSRKTAQDGCTRRVVASTKVVFEPDLMVDAGVSTVSGVVKDGVLEHGFARINHLDWADWLRHHGAPIRSAQRPEWCPHHDHLARARGVQGREPPAARWLS